jgi:glycosyltransferase involved in cell wall biosynthesis
MSKNRVLIIATSPKTRGGITSVINLYRESFIWEKWQCYWLSTHVDKSKLYKIFFFLRAVIRFLFIINRFDIVHVHLSEPASLLRKLYFICIAKLLKKKIILHFHSFSVDSTLNSKFRFLYLWAFKNANFIISLSEYWKVEIENILPIDMKDKVVCIYNPTSLKFMPTDTYNEMSKVILFAGTLNARKGFRDLILAFSKVDHITRAGWKLFFAGNGDIESGQLLSEELGISDCVEFKGWVTGDLKEQLFKNSGIFCLPSYAEGFPMAVLDALAHGIPVITTPVGGILDVFIDKKNCIMFSPGNISLLVDGLSSLMSDGEFRSRLSSESKSLAMTEFDISKISLKLDDLYDSCI